MNIKLVITVVAAIFLPLAGKCGEHAKSATPLPKWVFAHVMGMMPATSWWGFNNVFPLTDVGKRKPANTFTRLYGGQYRVQPLGALYAYTDKQGKYNFNRNLMTPPNLTPQALKPRYIKNPYLWDIEQADKMGIDGFALCLSGNEASYAHAVKWFETLENFLKKQPETNLRLTIVISGHELPNVCHNPRKYAWLKRFLAKFKNSPAWLRHENRLVLMGYHSILSWDSKDYADENCMEKAIEAHLRFLSTLNLNNPIFIFDGPEYVPGQITYRNLNPQPALLGKVAGLACEYFDVYTCWGGLIPNEIYPGNYKIIADAVNAKGKAWMMPILNLHSGIGQFYYSSPGVQRFLDTWDYAESTKAQMVNLITWNDSNEATNFQPSISWNYALSSLTAKFIYKFKHGRFPKIVDDSIYLFYRKYHPDAEPYLYPKATVERDRDTWGKTDDVLHVIVFAKEKGTLEVSGTSNGTDKMPIREGYNVFKLRTAVNKEISAVIYRDGKMAAKLVSPERVTDHPYREDLVPWGWSSDCRKLYDRDFGLGFRPISYYSQRYNDGIPDWFRLHYFGTTELEDGMKATDDPDGDGVDNLHEYISENDPLTPNPQYYPGFSWNVTKALSVAKDQPFAERINMNPYPDGNGKLTHAFMFQKIAAKPSANYHFMTKWVNQVKGVKTGWTFRSGLKQHYYLSQDGGITMELLPGLRGVYGFRSPVGGELEVSCDFKGDKTTPVKLLIRNVKRQLFSANCLPASDLTVNFKTNVSQFDQINFIVQASVNKSVVVTLRPSIKLIK